MVMPNFGKSNNYLPNQVDNIKLILLDIKNLNIQNNNNKMMKMYLNQNFRKKKKKDRKYTSRYKNKLKIIIPDNQLQKNKVNSLILDLLREKILMILLLKIKEKKEKLQKMNKYNIYQSK